MESARTPLGEALGDWLGDSEGLGVGEALGDSGYERKSVQMEVMRQIRHSIICCGQFNCNLGNTGRTCAILGSLASHFGRLGP